MRIVVGYDGSDAAKRALQRAADLAKEGDQIVVVASAEAHARSGPAGGGIATRLSSSSERGALEEAKQFLSEQGLDAELVEAQGDPGTAIVEAASETDLIIVGSRGLNPVQRLLLGSVSSKVVHRAQGDVLVVR